MPRNLTPWDGDLPNYDRWKEGAGQKLPGSPYYDSEVETPDESDPDGLEDDRDLYDESDGWMYDENRMCDPPCHVCEPEDTVCITVGCEQKPLPGDQICEDCLDEIQASEAP